MSYETLSWCHGVMFRLAIVVVAVARATWAGLVLIVMSLCGGCYCQGDCLGVVARYGLTLVLVLGRWQQRL